MALVYSALEDLTAQIKQYVPNCPPNQLTLQLSRTVRDFFAKTEIWQSDVSVSIVAGTTVYDLPFEDDVFVNDLVSARIEDYDLLSQIELTGDREITVEAQFALDYDGYDLLLKSVVVPYVMPCVIPSRMVNRYSEFLIAGAVANICGIPGKSYSNENLEFKMADRWQRGLTRASTDVATANKKNIVRWRG